MAEESQESSLQASEYRWVKHKPPKKRATRACLECRRRKVRCDILKQNLTPCTNCRLDGVICRLTRLKRKVLGSQYPPQSPESTLASLQPTTPIVERCSFFIPNEDMTTFSHVLHDNLDPTIDQEQAAADRFCQNSNLPMFIKPLPDNLLAEDWQYLKSKNCFTFPPHEFEQCVFQRFAEYVHPLLPVVDMNEIISTVTGQSFGQLSLLLYYTLMGAGLAAVEINLILKYGYVSKASARKDFYAKAKLLLDMEVETDRLVCCQAALLFISWSSNNDPKDGLHWIGAALTQAYSINLQKAKSGLERRVWWAIIMKEADVCLAMGKPPRILSPDTPILGPDEACFACIEKSKLSLVIHKVIRFLHTNNPSNRDSRIWQLDSELQDWRHQLLDPHQGTQLMISMVKLEYLMAIVMLHRSEISVQKWSKYLEGSTELYLDEELSRCQGHARAVRRAADKMTQIHKELYDANLVSVIPAFGVATICAAVGVHLLDACSVTTRARSLQQLDFCLDLLTEVRNIHYTAGEVAKIVELAIATVREKKPLSKRVQTGTAEILCSTLPYPEDLDLEDATIRADPFLDMEYFLNFDTGKDAFI